MLVIVLGDMMMSLRSSSNLTSFLIVSMVLLSVTLVSSCCSRADSSSAFVSSSCFSIAEISALAASRSFLVALRSSFVVRN